jgi:hypothetical protein
MVNTGANHASCIMVCTHIKNIESQKFLKVSIAIIPKGAESKHDAHAIQLFDKRDF